MLHSLRIKNLAIVEDVRVEFGDGLNVITGETGAGKSVIVGALSLLLGERADKSLIRTGAEHCAVEAVFATKRLHALLDELGLGAGENGEVIVRRQFNAAGTGKVFINDSPATVQALKRIGELLVDMHGPHDHQSLLNREFQLDLLDAFGHVNTTAYRVAYRGWLDLQQERVALNAGDADVAQQIDFLKFQIKEIEQADIVNLDENELVAEHSRSANAQRILELAEGIQQALTDGDASAFEGLAAAQRQLGELAGIEPEAEAWKKEAAGLAGQLQELAGTVAGYAQKIDADPQRLQWLEERLGTFHKLKRKYGADIREFLEKARQRLNDLETRGERAEKLDAEIVKAARQVEKLAKELAGARRTAAKKLAGAVTKELKDLGFAHGSFGVTLTPAATPGPRGMDEIEFNFAPNVGEPARPLRQIASSGEMSRVMLATKVVLAEHDRVTVLVFDEIDANVGGEMGTAIGEKLRAVAAGHQVICITHLPQVAAQGTTHLVVNKTVQAGRTTAGITPVIGDARAEEIARMLGGKDSTSVALRHAQEMLRKRTSNRR